MAKPTESTAELDAPANGQELAELDGNDQALADFGGMDMIGGDGDLAEMRLDDIDLSNVPTVEQRLAEAKMPVLKKTSDLVGKDVIWLAWKPAEALLENTGEVTEGYFCLGKEVATGQLFTVFIGGIALCRTLRNVKAPMLARIERPKRVLVFA